MTRYWPEEAWLPVQLPGTWDPAARPLSLCPECARFGYHSSIHQLPHIKRCPWHRVRLLSACPRCKSDLHPNFPGSDDIGVCRCTHDFFSHGRASVRQKEFPAGDVLRVGLGDWIRACSHRATWTVLSPDGRCPADATLDCLIGSSGFDADESRRPLGMTHRRIKAPRRPLRFDEADVFTLTQLASDKPLPFGRLSLETANPLFRVWEAAVLAAQAPDASSSLVRHLKPSRVIPPFSNNGDASPPWMNLTAIPSPALALVGRLVVWLVPDHAANISPLLPPMAPDVRRSKRLLNSDDVGCCVLVIRRILARGLWEGAIRVLASHSRSPNGKLREGPAPSLSWPYCLLKLDAGRIVELHLHWVPMSLNEQCELAPFDDPVRRISRPARRPRSSKPKLCKKSK